MYTDSESNKTKILLFYLEGATAKQTAERFNIDIGDGQGEASKKKLQKLSNWLYYHTKRRTAAGGKRKTQKLKNSYL